MWCVSAFKGESTVVRYFESFETALFEFFNLRRTYPFRGVSLLFDPSVNA